MTLNVVQTEETDYVRDTSNHALINTNARALYEHRMKRKQAMQINKLETDMQYIMTTMLELSQAFKKLGMNK